MSTRLIWTWPYAAEFVWQWVWEAWIEFSQNLNLFFSIILYQGAKNSLKWRQRGWVIIRAYACSFLDSDRTSHEIAVAPLQGVASARAEETKDDVSTQSRTMPVVNQFYLQSLVLFGNWLCIFGKNTVFLIVGEFEQHCHKSDRCCSNCSSMDQRMGHTLNMNLIFIAFTLLLVGCRAQEVSIGYWVA